MHAERPRGDGPQNPTSSDLPIPTLTPPGREVQILPVSEIKIRGIVRARWSSMSMVRQTPQASRKHAALPCLPSCAPPHPARLRDLTLSYHTLFLLDIMSFDLLSTTGPSKRPMVPRAKAGCHDGSGWGPRGVRNGSNRGCSGAASDGVSGRLAGVPQTTVPQVRCMRFFNIHSGTH